MRQGEHARAAREDTGGGRAYSFVVATKMDPPTVQSSAAKSASEPSLTSNSGSLAGSAWVSPTATT